MKNTPIVEEELQIDKVRMSEHAYQRAAERFNLKDRKHAFNYFKGILRNCRCIGSHFSDEGKPSVLYAKDRHAIYLSTDLKTIVTVNHYDNVTYEPIKKLVSEIHAKEIRKLTRIENAKKKRIKLSKLKCDIELAQLKYKMETTRSENVRKTCEQRISEITEYINNMEAELKYVQDSIRQISRSMVAVV